LAKHGYKHPAKAVGGRGRSRMDAARAPLSTDANWRCTPGGNRQAVDVVHAQTGNRYVYTYPFNQLNFLVVSDFSLA